MPSPHARGSRPTAAVAAVVAALLLALGGVALIARAPGPPAAEPGAAADEDRETVTTSAGPPIPVATVAPATAVVVPTTTSIATTTVAPTTTALTVSVESTLATAIAEPAANAESRVSTAALPRPEPVGISLDDATQTIRSYLLAAGARSYEEAWSILASPQKDAYGGFSEFTRFWDGISLVGIDSLSEIGRSATAPEGLSVEALLWFDVIGGTRSNEVVHIDVGVVDGRMVITDYRFVGLR